jgi:glucokinase
MKKKYAIGADTGGSHISVIAMDLEKEVIFDCCYSNSNVDNKASAEEILDIWKTAIEKSIAGIDKDQLAGIGIAMPGPFDYANGIALFTSAVNKYENLYGINIGDRLRQLLDLPDDVSIRFMNDATSFAIGDAWKGKSCQAKKSISITLGTGFGAAFIESGIPVLERDDVPEMGCLYYIPYKESIANDYFCTGWFVKSYTNKTGKTLTGVKEIAAEALTNPEVNEIFVEFGAALGEFLAPFIQNFNADCLVIGGNINRAYHLFGPAFSSTLKSINIDICVELSEQMETSAMIGSARLIDEDFWGKVKPLLPLM